MQHYLSNPGHWLVEPNSKTLHLPILCLIKFGSLPSYPDSVKEFITFASFVSTLDLITMPSEFLSG